MKQKLKLLVALMLLVAVTVATAAPLFPPRRGTFSDVPSWVAGNATSNVVSDPVALHPNRGIAIWPKFAGTNAATTGNFICRLELTPDGTNWSTTGLYLTNTANGATGVMGYHLLTAEVLDNAKAVRLQTIQNANDATNGLFPTNITWSLFP